MGPRNRPAAFEGLDFCSVLQSIARDFFNRRSKMAAARFSEPGDVQAISLNVIAFPGASNWPLWAGQQKGFFAAQGLDISVRITANSVQMARELHAGAVHVALTSKDNFGAYGGGKGEVAL